MKSTAESIAFPMMSAILIVLKLTHVIAWSWWWVTLPIWGYFAAALLIFVIGFPIYSRRQATLK